MKKLYSFLLIVTLVAFGQLTSAENKLSSFLISFLVKEPNTCVLEGINDPHELNLMGVTYFANKENGKAIACFERAAEKGSGRAALFLKKVGKVLKEALDILEIKPSGNTIDNYATKLIDVFNIPSDCPCHPAKNMFYDYSWMFELGQEYLKSDFLVKAAHCFTWGCVGLSEHQKLLTGQAHDQEIMASQEYQLFRSLEHKLVKAKTFLLGFYDVLLLEEKSEDLGKTKTEL